MSKGMSIDQFRAALESDATKRAESQEKIIAELHGKIHTLENERDCFKDASRKLSNRCMALTRGLTCLFCGLKGICRAGESEGSGSE